MTSQSLTLCVRSAVGWYASHKEFYCDPAQLLAECQEWKEVMQRQLINDQTIVVITPDMLEDAMWRAGILAARECAMLCKEHKPKLLNPEDLK